MEIEGIIELSYFGSVKEVEMVLGSGVLVCVAALLLTRFFCLGGAGLTHS